MRRGLATNPEVFDMPDGHEPAWLTMQLSRDQDKDGEIAPPPTPAASHGTNESPSRILWAARLKNVLMLRRKTSTGGESHELHAADTMDIPAPIWEFPTLRSPLRTLSYFFDTFDDVLHTSGVQPFAKLEANDNPNVDTFLKCRDRFRFLFQRLFTETPYSIEDLPIHQESEEVVLHESIQSLMPRHDRISDIANKLAVAIEKLATKFESINKLAVNFDSTRHAINWTDESPHPFQNSTFRWSIPVIVQTLTGNRMMKAVTMGLFRPDSVPDETEGRTQRTTQSWTLDNRNQLRSVLCLWVYTLAERSRTVSMTRECQNNCRSMGWRENDDGEIDPMRREPTYIRVVGTCSSADYASGATYRRQQANGLSQWIGKDVGSFPSSCDGIILDYSMDDVTDILRGREWPVFGSFVSSLSL